MSCSVYNPKKPNKWRIQIKSLCDSNSRYVYSLKLWDGEKTTILASIKELINGLEYCNHYLFMDNYYNSLDNARSLLNFGVYITGNFRKRRGGPEIMNIKKLMIFQRKCSLL